jgi:hypothetical protein
MENKIIEDLKSENQKLIEALKKIEQMSDPGSYEKAIIEMKSIATNALKKSIKCYRR